MCGRLGPAHVCSLVGGSVFGSQKIIVSPSYGIKSELKYTSSIFSDFLDLTSLSVHLRFFGGRGVTDTFLTVLGKA